MAFVRTCGGRRLLEEWIWTSMRPQIDGRLPADPRADRSGTHRSPIHWAGLTSFAAAGPGPARRHSVVALSICTEKSLSFLQGMVGKRAMIVTYDGHGGDTCGAPLRQVLDVLNMNPIATMPGLIRRHLLSTP
jgi:hypothetical protein